MPQKVRVSGGPAGWFGWRAGWRGLAALFGPGDGGAAEDDDAGGGDQAAGELEGERAG
jgi:hypothetical protein